LAELGALLQLDQSTVHRQVTALEEAGDVERVPDPGGARAARLRLTAGGRSRLAATRAGRADRIGRILAGWSPEDRATLGSLLARLNADLVRLGDDERRRPGSTPPST